VACWLTIALLATAIPAWSWNAVVAGMVGPLRNSQPAGRASFRSVSVRLPAGIDRALSQSTELQAALREIKPGLDADACPAAGYDDPLAAAPDRKTRAASYLRQGRSLREIPF